MDEYLLPQRRGDGEPNHTRRVPSPTISRDHHQLIISSGLLDRIPSWQQRRVSADLSPEEAIALITNSSTSFINLKNKRKMIRHKSHSAPSVFTEAREAAGPNSSSSSSSNIYAMNVRSTPSLVRQASICVIIYLLTGLAFFTALGRSGFKVKTTSAPVDGLYFSIVTLCTIGYGDIVPDTPITKLLMCAFILVGFGSVDVLLNGLVTYVLDRQEAVLLGAVDESYSSRCRFHAAAFMMVDAKKGRMRIRIKVGLALGVVVGCIAVGAITAHILEKLDWVDSFYLSVSSVTSVGYGDYAFSTLKGRCFAIVWLLVSTLAVARAFLYLTELRMERRNRKIARWVLQRRMTLGDLVAADLDNNGSVSKSEYVIYKLKEMGKISEKDILQICNQFDRLDTGNCGKITLADLMENHH